MTVAVTILPGGDELTVTREAAVVRFCGKRKTLSTGAVGGGLRSGLQAVFNHNDCPRAGAYCEMQGNSMEEHQQAAARQLGLNPDTTTGLNTGANTDNTAVVTLTYDNFSVTAIVTGGVEVNATRVGSPATLHEQSGIAQVVAGTINILLVVDANLTDGCMARALSTCTEAKVAALQELAVSSRYGRELATGSGTDGIVVISNMESPVGLTEAGTHYKLGELIGKAVIQGVKEALYRQSGLCAGMQHNVFRRLERYGVTPSSVKATLEQAGIGQAAGLDTMLEHMSLDGSVVTCASLYAHLLDQMTWGLLLPQEAAQMGEKLLDILGEHYGMPRSLSIPASEDPAVFAQQMADAFIATVVDWVAASLPQLRA